VAYPWLVLGDTLKYMSGGMPRDVQGMAALLNMVGTEQCDAAMTNVLQLYQGAGKLDPYTKDVAGKGFSNAVHATTVILHFLGPLCLYFPLLDPHAYGQSQRDREKRRERERTERHSAVAEERVIIGSSRRVQAVSGPGLSPSVMEKAWGQGAQGGVLSQLDRVMMSFPNDTTDQTLPITDIGGVEAEEGEGKGEGEVAGKGQGSIGLADDGHYRQVITGGRGQGDLASGLPRGARDAVEAHTAKSQAAEVVQEPLPALLRPQVSGSGQKSLAPVAPTNSLAAGAVDGSPPKGMGFAGGVQSIDIQYAEPPRSYGRHLDQNFGWQEASSVVHLPELKETKGRGRGRGPRGINRMLTNTPVVGGNIPYAHPPSRRGTGGKGVGSRQKRKRFKKGRRQRGKRKARSRRNAKRGASSAKGAEEEAGSHALAFTGDLYSFGHPNDTDPTPTGPMPDGHGESPEPWEFITSGAPPPSSSAVRRAPSERDTPSGHTSDEGHGGVSREGSTRPLSVSQSRAPPHPSLSTFQAHHRAQKKGHVTGALVSPTAPRSVLHPKPPSDPNSSVSAGGISVRHQPVEGVTRHGRRHIRILHPVNPTRPAEVVPLTHWSTSLTVTEQASALQQSMQQQQSAAKGTHSKAVYHHPSAPTTHNLPSPPPPGSLMSPIHLRRSVYGGSQSQENAPPPASPLVFSPPPLPLTPTHGVAPQRTPAPRAPAGNGRGYTGGQVVGDSMVAARQRRYRHATLPSNKLAAGDRHLSVAVPQAVSVQGSGMDALVSILTQRVEG
ncbi:hypothetical protein KIPB_009665, partial [Kipferlia bialata]